MEQRQEIELLLQDTRLFYLNYFVLYYLSLIFLNVSQFYFFFYNIMLFLLLSNNGFQQFILHVDLNYHFRKYILTRPRPCFNLFFSVILIANLFMTAAILKLFVLVASILIMQRILKLFLKQNPGSRTNYRGLDAQPIKAWKRNAIAGFFGSVLGLYVGQYFPDLYFATIEPYLPSIEQLHQLAPSTQALKPAPDYPKPIGETPESILVQMGRRKPVASGSFEVRNDVTREKQTFKVTRVFAPERREDVQS